MMFGRCDAFENKSEIWITPVWGNYCHVKAKSLIHCIITWVSISLMWTILIIVNWFGIPFGGDPRSLPDKFQVEFAESLNDSTAQKPNIFLNPHPFKSFGRPWWRQFHRCQKCVKSLVFPSDYCYEQGFSTMYMMNNKFCSRLSVEHALCVCLSDNFRNSSTSETTSTSSITLNVGLQSGD